jgi:hypothetical protein
MRRYTVAEKVGPRWTWAGQQHGASRADALRRLGLTVEPRARYGRDREGRIFAALRASDSFPTVGEES